MWLTVRHQAGQAMTDARSAVPALLGEIRSEARQTIWVAKAESKGQLLAINARSELDLGRVRERTDRSIRDLAASARRVLDDAATRSEGAMREIAGQGPAKTLGRGFAIVRTGEGLPVTSAAAAPVGTQIHIQFRDGTLAARTHDEGKPE